MTEIGIYLDGEWEDYISIEFESYIFHKNKLND